MPPTFDGIYKVGPEEKAWLLGMGRYFKIHDYSMKEKAQITILSLSGQTLICLEHLLEVKGIQERRMTWE